MIFEPLIAFTVFFISAQVLFLIIGLFINLLSSDFDWFVTLLPTTTYFVLLLFFFILFGVLWLFKFISGVG